MTEFEEIVANGGEAMQARWVEAQEQVCRDSTGLLGITLAPSDVGALPEVKAFVFGGAEQIEDSWVASAAHLESVKTRRAELEAAEAVKAGETGALEEINKLPRAARMARARRDGLDAEAHVHKTAPTSVADEATLLRQALSIRNPAARIAYARRHGVGGLT